MRFTLPFLFVTAFTLAGCGGGGSDSGGTTTPPVSSNNKPTVDAGNNQTVNANTAVTLNGSASDSDGSISQYQWTQISGDTVSLSGATTATLTFVAPSSVSALTLQFRLTVTDNQGATANDSVTITINADVSNDPVLAEFAANISEIVQNTCRTCHVSGGAAAASALNFISTANSDHLQQNNQEFVDYVDGDGAKANVVLQKIQGMLAHGGSVQLVAGSDGYNKIEHYLSLMADLSQGDSNPPPVGETAQQMFTSSISAQIVQSQCISCHISGGVADSGSQSARIIFVPATESEHLTRNHQRMVDFMALPDVNTDYILNKVAGQLGHGGGQQLSTGHANYQSLQTYLNLITGESIGQSIDFFTSASLSDNAQTLRRAAIFLAGRLPTAAEYSAVSSGSDASLRQGIRALMSGDGFHDFLIEGANNRLLTLKYEEAFADFLEPNNIHFPELAMAHFNAQSEGQMRGDEFWREHRKARIGFARAPLELIAHVVENDKPYSEILTADYTMINSQLNLYYRSNVNFADDESHLSFKVGQQQGYMLADRNAEAEYVENVGLKIIKEGEIIDWPHAGVLNDPAFLNRYPSTATNRNRARARWTYYHFLGFDIEKSAARTTDPVALADTNNPTLNNPACVVCHEIMDPVAGTFQNYGDNGHYRDSWGGNDSLPQTYKDSDDSPYIHGDTWYKTMLTPGFAGEYAPNADNSIQWLAEKIVADDRFAVATVKFWWHTLMGTAPATLPDSQDDYDYASRKALFDAQDAFIHQIAASFRTHLKLKDLLTEMVMSPWFRLSGLATSQESLHAANKNGVGQLLTPEQLDRKTKAITGLSWGEHYPEWRDYERYSNLTQEYRLTYGGIDSNGINVRASDMTSIMAQVALTHASEMACPVVLLDFNRKDAERKLFAGINKTDTPDSNANLIKSKLVELHSKLLGENLSVTDSEITHSFNLLKSAQQQNLARNTWNHIMEDNLFCNVDWGQYAVGNLGGWEVLGEDPEAMLSAWQTLLVYLMSDFAYVYE